MSLFWFTFAAALLPLAYYDSSVHSVAGLLKAAGVLCFMVGSALSPSMFFESLGTLTNLPKPATRGMVCFIALMGAGSAVELVSSVMKAF